MSSSDSITWNGEEYDADTFSKAFSVARNTTEIGRGGLGGADVTRNPDVLRRFGKQYNGDRDIVEVLGYDDLEDDTALERYRAKYERQDIAKRIVDIFPAETWRDAPELIDEGSSDSEFERQANRLISTTLNHYWHRVDKAQRLGEFGVLVFGFDDGQNLDQRVNTSALNSPDDIAFVNVHPQEEVEDWTLGKEEEDGEHSNPEDERYNKPVRYYIDFGDVDAENVDDEFRWVHWTRVFPHVAEDNLETDLKGQPALKPVYNRLDDLQKTVGASAEMFWAGANPKYIANVKDEFALQQFQNSGARQDFKEDFQRLVHELQNYMVSQGMEYQEFGGQEVDPSGVVDNVIQMISAATNIPKNKLLGNEMGERSTTQDRRNWFDTITSRRTNFATPTVVRPTIDRLVSYGILPDPDGGDYRVEFPNLFEPTEQEKAETQTQRAQQLTASQLAMSLSAEDKITWITDGPEALDLEPVEETPVDESDDNVIDAFSNFNNIDFLGPDIDLTPPTKSQQEAQSVLDARDDPGKKLKGLTRQVEAIADIIASGEELTPEGVDDLFTWFKEHPQEDSDIPQIVDWWRSRPVVAEKAHGGSAMREWVTDMRRTLVMRGELDAETDTMADAEGMSENEATPPSQAQTNAQAVLDIREKTDAMTDTGWRRAKQLADGGSVSDDVIQKMAQFKRHQSNTEYENYADIPESKKSEEAENPWWEDNGTVAWLGWGGTAGVEWAVEQSGEITENQSFSEGDVVETPDGKGVVAGIVTESVEIGEESVDATEDEPGFIVALVSGGFGAFPESDLSESSFDEEEKEPAELAESESENIYKKAQTKNVDLHSEAFVGFCANQTKWLGFKNEDPEVGFRTLPDGWDRGSVLQAWASLGGRFTSCRRDMAGEIASPTRFCAALKDEVLQTEEWRGKF